MQRPHYLDPLGSRPPALERSILQLRSMQIVLVLFYAEQLKQKVLGLVENANEARIHMGDSTSESPPRGAKDRVKRCLRALMADGAISTSEGDEIKRLIDYRNVVAHDIHELVTDLNTERHIRRGLDFIPVRAPYDYEAVDRLRYYLNLLDERQIAHHYIGTISFDGLLFNSAERMLLDDIKKLRARIQRQAQERKERIQELNKQIRLEERVRDEEHPHHPLNQHDNKRLTKRGQEACYRLFDQGKLPIAVAHLMGISLVAARKRRRMWEIGGGISRPAVDLNALSRRKFCRRRDD
jgi:hypothetical protein